ncbi:MAG TPA: excinuclease ABC subunit UvrB, partial [Bradyrhizobium sp.]
MAKNPDHPKKPAKAPKSKAHRPDVQPIGPALAELLNPAINRGESGLGSGTGLQPPPDNSWDRRAGGEAAAHRARASTKATGDDVAKKDVAAKRVTAGERDASSPPPVRRSAAKPDGGERSGVGGTRHGCRCPLKHPHPRPLPTASRGEERSAGNALGVDEGLSRRRKT